MGNFRKKVLWVILLPIWLINIFQTTSYSGSKLNCNKSTAEYTVTHDVIDFEKVPFDSPEKNMLSGCSSLSFYISTSSNFELLAYWQPAEKFEVAHYSHYTSIIHENDPDPPKAFNNAI